MGLSGAPKKPPPVSAEAASEIAFVPTGLDLTTLRGGGGGAPPLPRPAGGPRPLALGAGPVPDALGAGVAVPLPVGRGYY